VLKIEYMAEFVERCKKHFVGIVRRRAKCFDGVEEDRASKTRMLHWRILIIWGLKPTIKHHTQSVGSSAKCLHVIACRKQNGDVLTRCTVAGNRRQQIMQLKRRNRNLRRQGRDVRPDIHRQLNYITGGRLVLGRYCRLKRTQKLWR